jgi:hypothetical protein
MIKTVSHQDVGAENKKSSTYSIVLQPVFGPWLSRSSSSKLFSSLPLPFSN